MRIRECKCGAAPEIREWMRAPMRLYVVRCPKCHEMGGKSLLEERAVLLWNKERKKNERN